ncbi:MAG: hypothetical protein ACE5Z5_07580 [Candidatus Bathyarchaeia archaeon]
MRLFGARPEVRSRMEWGLPSKNARYSFQPHLRASQCWVGIR